MSNYTLPLSLPRLRYLNLRAARHQAERLARRTQVFSDWVTYHKLSAALH